MNEKYYYSLCYIFYTWQYIVRKPLNTIFNLWLAETLLFMCVVLTWFSDFFSARSACVWTALCLRPARLSNLVSFGFCKSIRRKWNQIITIKVWYGFQRVWKNNLTLRRINTHVAIFYVRHNQTGLEPLFQRKLLNLVRHFCIRGRVIFYSETLSNYKRTNYVRWRRLIEQRLLYL
jgi:hypothetical protein